MRSTLILSALLPLLWMGMTARAQTENPYAEADRFFALGKFREALALYSDQKGNDLHRNERIGHCHYYLNRYADAEKSLGRLMDVKDIAPVTVRYYGEVLMALGKYADAELVLERYSMMPDAADVGTLVASAEWAAAHRDDRPDHGLHVTNIATGGRSVGVALGDGGMYHGAPRGQADAAITLFYDLTFSPRTDSVTFGSPQPLPKGVNARFYTGSPALSADGKELFFSRNASKKDEVNVKRKAKLGISDDGVNALQIMRAVRVEGQWGDVTPMPFNSIQHSCTHPHLSADGRTMFFVSNMPGGQGGFDIYKVTRNSIGQWGEPVNLGPSVNTAGNEMFPHLHDGTLYFASNGGIGFGGYDIYRAEAEGEKFAKAVNAGTGLNSSKDDFAIVFEQGTEGGYLSSNREGDNGHDRVYLFRRIYYPFSVDVSVLDKVTTKPIAGAKVTIAFTDGTVWKELETDAEGKLSFELYPNIDYVITFAKEGYETQTIDVPRGTPRESIVARLGNVEMSIEVKKDVVINLDNIYFGLGSAEPLAESLPLLDRLVRFMRDNPGARIELSAHTDSRGGDAYNMNLSDRRAHACFDHLVANGIDRSRVVPKGYGKSRLLNHCADGVYCSEDLHQKNRRVEVKVL